MQFRANCRSVLIGSLPLTDHRDALDLIVRHTPEIPLWPQLPKKPKEGMIRQFLTGFPGLRDSDNGKDYHIDTEHVDFADKMALFYEEYLRISDDPSLLTNSRFGLGDDTAPGFGIFLDYLNNGPDIYAAKGQITGPVTTGIGCRDAHGRSIIYDENLRDMLVKLLALKARWQVSRLTGFSGDREPVLFIDEPGMVSFGSSGFSGISAELVSSCVDEVIEAIHQGGGLAGIHICANGDWGPPLDSAADIISFDAYFYFDNFVLFREPLLRFIERGGILAWGIIPTGDPDVIARESLDSLYEKWLSQLDALSKLGCDRKKLLSQTLIAPSCGTGSLSPELATKVLQLTGELSQRARQLFKNI